MSRHLFCDQEAEPNQLLHCSTPCSTYWLYGECVGRRKFGILVVMMNIQDERSRRLHEGTDLLPALAGGNVVQDIFNLAARAACARVGSIRSVGDARPRAPPITSGIMCPISSIFS